MQCDPARDLWTPQLLPVAQAHTFWVCCVMNWGRCRPCVIPHRARQGDGGDLPSSAAAGQTRSWLHDLQFA